MRSAQLKRQIQLQQWAWLNRLQPTATEAMLWSALRACKLGVPFRRQVPLCGRYIADFLAPSVKLVIEVDGSCHASRRCADARRDRMLAREGYRTLRLPAALVAADLRRAVLLVAQALRSR